ADWQKDMGMTVTENWITAYGDIDAVFANNDEMALGAINALQEAGMTETLVIGIDGTKGALDAIKAGTLAGSVFQDAEGQAKGAMEIAVKTASGEEIAEQIKWIPFILITPENVGDFE
ncbi:MAG: substrate-binding domain-containing protein, partial [Bacillota bacterium]